MKQLILLVLITVATCGCTDAEKADLFSLGKRHRVTMYSGGKKVEEWVSSGVVHNESKSDGFYFSDSKTGVVVHVTGDVVITPIVDTEKTQ